MSKDNNQQTEYMYTAPEKKELPIDKSANQIAENAGISRNKLRGAVKKLDLATLVIPHITAGKNSDKSTVAWLIPYETESLFRNLAKACKSKNAASREYLEQETFRLLAEELDKKLGFRSILKKPSSDPSGDSTATSASNNSDTPLSEPLSETLDEMIVEADANESQTSSPAAADDSSSPSADSAAHASPSPVSSKSQQNNQIPITATTFSDTVLLIEERIQNQLLEKHRSMLHNRFSALEKLLQEEISPFETLTRMQKAYAALDDVLISLLPEKPEKCDAIIPTTKNDHNDLKNLYLNLTGIRSGKLRIKSSKNPLKWSIQPSKTHESGEQIAYEFARSIHASQEQKKDENTSNVQEQESDGNTPYDLEKINQTFDQYLYSLLDASDRENAELFAQGYIELSRYTEAEDESLAVNVMENKFREYIIDLFSNLKDGYFVPYSTAIDVPGKTVHTSAFQFFDRQFKNMCDHISYSIFHELVWLCELKMYEPIYDDLKPYKFEEFVKKTWIHIEQKTVELLSTEENRSLYRLESDSDHLHRTLATVLLAWENEVVTFLEVSSFECSSLPKNIEILKRQLEVGKRQVIIHILFCILQMACITLAVIQAKSRLKEIRESQLRLKSYLQKNL